VYDKIKGLLGFIKLYQDMKYVLITRYFKNVVLHDDELHNLYASSNITGVIKSRGMRWVGNVADMGEMRSAYRILVGNLEGKRPFGRPKCRWEDNIRMDLRKIQWEDVDGTHLTLG
jgi:hypothetical protein